MKERQYSIFACDFETSVYKGQTSTEVWAACLCQLNTEDALLLHSIDDFYNYLLSLNKNLICYFHNLKFDGNFIIYYLINTLHYQQAFIQLDEKGLSFEKQHIAKMKNKTFSYSISEMGQWYNITVKVNNKIIEFRDSLKLLPFTLKKIGESFKTKHKKLEMEYEGYRYAGCPITEEEERYIKNDVYVLKEALEIMFSEGHNKLTIGSCCLAEYKKIISLENYNDLMPNIYEVEIDENIYGKPNAGEYIRKAYRGGWCYLAKGKANKVFYNGTTADVNSLYPSMMHSESGNVYPTGYPTFWKGNFIPPEAYGVQKYFFVRIKTRFYLKPGFLPFIQIKNDLRYKGTESLETSDFYDKKTHKYYKRTVNEFGEVKDTICTLTLTQTDYNLILKHYNLEDFEILDGCYFTAYAGLFDDYINKYKEIKMTSTGAKRELAKLYLNNLYGKMAANVNSSFKMCYMKEDETMGFETIEEKKKKPGYIPIGAAITSYARNFTITAAQKNFHGKDKPGFIYADTDSIHCDLSPDEIVGIKVDPSNFCCWKLESCWDKGLFVRQKTYVEHVTKEDLKPVDEPYYNIKCAGMPEISKQLFLHSMLQTKPNNYEKLSDEEKLFIQQKRELTDFKLGLIVPGKLRPVRIPGGVLLVDTSYEMR